VAQVAFKCATVARVGGPTLVSLSVGVAQLVGTVCGEHQENVSRLACLVVWLGMGWSGGGGAPVRQMATSSHFLNFPIIFDGLIK
jgi:hypothetical protein